MQHKLKSILHNAGKRKSSSTEYVEETAPYYHETSPHAEQQHTRITDQPQVSNRDSQQSGRSAPLNSTHNDSRSSNAPALQHTTAGHSNTSGSNNEPVMNDRTAHPPVEYLYDNQSRQLVTGHSNGRYEEDVADRNIDQYSPASYARRQQSAQQGGPTESTLPHRERTDYSTRIARNEHEPLPPKSDITSSRTHPEDNTIREAAPVKSQKQSAGSRSAFAGSLHEMKGAPNTDGLQDWELQQRSLLEGVVDLNDTVDTDKTTHWAPAVTHEVIKPHEHEIIQHRIYREIHNYSYYHRLQPVLQTEVLPPRHFIPNPKGDGLIEISADEVPARTGKNRWWDIVQKEVPQPSVPNNSHRWRTEPESIESAPYITEEGFERKETTIVYPPTLEDLSTYSGVVQPVHFDHKTGQRWLGELTTMSKLREGMQHMNLQEDSKDMSSSPVVKRKYVNGSHEEASVPRLGVTA